MRVTGGIAQGGAGILNEGTVASTLSLFDDNNAQIIGGAIFNVGTGEPAPRSRSSTRRWPATTRATAPGSPPTAIPHNQVLPVATPRWRAITGAAFWLQHDGARRQRARSSGPTSPPTIAGPATSVSEGAAVLERFLQRRQRYVVRADRRPTARTRIRLSPGCWRTRAAAPTCSRSPPTARPWTSSRRAPSRPTSAGFTRSPPGQPCDAGAYEQSGVGRRTRGADAGADADRRPRSRRRRRLPTATPDADPGGQPDGRGARGVAARCASSGRDEPVRRPRRNSRASRVGSTVDTKRGAVELTSVPKTGAPPETAKFHDGIFIVTQSRGITDLTLTEKLAACPKRGARRRAAQAEEPQALGRRQGQVPHHREVQRRDGPRHASGSSRTPARAPRAGSPRGPSPSATRSRRTSSCGRRSRTSRNPSDKTDPRRLRGLPPDRRARAGGRRSRSTRFDDPTCGRACPPVAAHARCAPRWRTPQQQRDGHDQPPGRALHRDAALGDSTSPPACTIIGAGADVTIDRRRRRRARVPS